jgi:hypothetical protein
VGAGVVNTGAAKVRGARERQANWLGTAGVEVRGWSGTLPSRTIASTHERGAAWGRRGPGRAGAPRPHVRSVISGDAKLEAATS